MEQTPAIDRERISEPERELNNFIDSRLGLVGAGGSRSLTELWLDELACMDYEFNWRAVSASASVKLAGRVIGSQLSGPSF
jgi:hypothetical protein